jgi:hypothetical protein
MSRRRAGSRAVAAAPVHAGRAPARRGAVQHRLIRPLPAVVLDGEHGSAPVRPGAGDPACRCAYAWSLARGEPARSSAGSARHHRGRPGRRRAPAAGSRPATAARPSPSPRGTTHRTPLARSPPLGRQPPASSPPPPRPIPPAQAAAPPWPARNTRRRVPALAGHWTQVSAAGTCHPRAGRRSQPAQFRGSQPAEFGRGTRRDPRRDDGHRLGHRHGQSGHRIRSVGHQFPLGLRALSVVRSYGRPPTFRRHSGTAG